MSLFTKLLKIGGRCASIVPQGVLFGSSAAHVAIRKELIERQRLMAVISMPSGIFQPYSGVATAILVFQRTDSGGTDDVWFYNMENDGFSLDQKRESIAANDIPDIIAKFTTRRMAHEKNVDRFKKWFNVPKQTIVENNYDLSFNKYHLVPHMKEDLPPVEELVKKLDELTAEFESGFAKWKGML